MKFKMLSLLCLSFAAGLAPSQTATATFDPLGEDVSADLPMLVRVQVEYIEMPHTSLTKLLKTPRTSGNDTDLRAECAKLVENKEAIVLETAIVIAKPGQKATSESIQEFIYPTEFEPPEPVSTQKDQKIITPALTGAPVATTFDTKNLGTTLEVELNIGFNSKIIDLRISPVITYYVGDAIWGEWNSAKAKASIRMPKFYTLRVSTGTTVIAGQTQMITVLSPKNKEGVTDHTRKIMVFVRADLLTVGR